MPTVADAWPALALLGVVLVLPWAAAWVKRRGWGGLKPSGQPVEVVSVLAVGPQQKVVTVAVDLGPHKKWLVLGVTPQSVTKLDSLDHPPQTPPPNSAHETLQS
jgi:flagellar protein FliO/FliZ